MTDLAPAYLRWLDAAPTLTLCLSVVFLVGCWVVIELVWSVLWWVVLQGRQTYTLEARATLAGPTAKRAAARG